MTVDQLDLARRIESGLMTFRQMIHRSRNGESRSELLLDIYDTKVLSITNGDILSNLPPKIFIAKISDSCVAVDGDMLG